MNMHRLNRWLLALTFFLAAAISSQAENGKPATAPVTIRFHCLSMNASSIDGLSFMNGKTEVPLIVPTEFLSPTYDYVGPAKLVFLRKVPLPPAGTKMPPSEYPPGREPAGTIEFSPETDEVLLLFNRSNDTTAIAAIDYTEKSVPVNGYLFWNLSNRPLMVSLGAAQCIIPSGQRQVITLKESDSYMALRIFDVHLNQARQVFASRTLHHPKTRQLIFLADSADNPDRLALRMVSQNFFLPKPKDLKPANTVAATTR